MCALLSKAISRQKSYVSAGVSVFSLVSVPVSDKDALSGVIISLSQPCALFTLITKTQFSQLDIQNVPLRKMALV